MKFTKKTVIRKYERKLSNLNFKQTIRVNEKPVEKPVEKPDNDKLPFVSVCTPTFNRRPFLPFLIDCFMKQNYPLNKMEWIIMDDGTDKIEDLVSHIPQVRYFKSDTKLSLGKKRNIMNEKCIGDIIVNMDDDDYYPPERVRHAVETLTDNSLHDIAGCDNVYIYFGKPEYQTYQIGPYQDYHATAATFAYRRCFLDEHKYDDEKAYGEESSFLNDFTVPLVKLNSKKTIIVFSHSLNTIDKRFIFNNKEHHKVKQVDKDITEIITNKKYKDFVVDNETYIKDYEFGKRENKKDIIEKIDNIKEKNKKKGIIIDNIKDELQEHNKEDLINIILELKKGDFMKNEKKGIIIDTMKVELQKHTKENLIKIILNLKIENYIQNKKENSINNLQKN